MIPPNIALLAWPLIAIWLFKTLPFERAIIWSVLGSFLFLPSNFAIDLPGLPPMDKQSLPNLALLLIILISGKKQFKFLPANRLAATMVLILIIGSFLTALNNSDPILIASRSIPGMTTYDALSNTIRTLLVIVPFFIGWQYLSSQKSHEEVLKVLVAAGFLYSTLMLFEIRMSPQLHSWVYGYFPHSFLQQVRWGGFRPVVFLNHGLAVAFFAMAIMIASLTLYLQASKPEAAAKAKQGFKMRYLGLTGYFAIILLLCKSLGSIVYGAFLAPVLFFFQLRTQMLIAAILAGIALSYPILRGLDLVPTDTLLDWASIAGAERAGSLETRFVNEEKLLTHAEQRPFFGWGSWGRNRVFDADTGADISITDGLWVITIGTTGWAGYIALFGLLAIPILTLFYKSLKEGPDALNQVTVALCLIIGINMIDLLPNAGLYPWTWLVAGALLGHTTQTYKIYTDKAPEVQDDHPRTVL